jgi:hypothetical protein
MATPVRRRGTSGDGYGPSGPSTVPLQRHLLFDNDDSGMTPDHYFTTPAAIPSPYTAQGPLSFSSNGRFTSPLPFGVSPRTPIGDDLDETTTLYSTQREGTTYLASLNAGRASPYAADSHHAERHQYYEAVQIESAVDVRSDNSLPTPPSEINWDVSVKDKGRRTLNFFFLRFVAESSCKVKEISLRGCDSNTTTI